jgi:hypothetical protein
MDLLNLYPCLTPVRVVATTNQSGVYYNGISNNGVNSTFKYSSLGQLTIDSVDLQVNDSVLLQSQTNSNENGIYVVLDSGASGSFPLLKRRSDLQCIEQLKGGFSVNVSEGTTNKGTSYSFAAPLPQIFGVSPLTIKAIGGTGGGGGVTPAEVQSSAFNYTVDTGTDGTAYIASLSPAPTLSDDLVFSILPANTNTINVPSLNLNGNGFLDIRLPGSQGLAIGDIVANVAARIQYVSASNNFILLNPQQTLTFGTSILNFLTSIFLFTDTGTLNNLVVTQSLYPNNTLQASSIFVNPAFTNTGAATLSYNGGSKPITLPDGSALSGGEIVAGQYAELIIKPDFSAWILLNSALGGGGSGVTPAQIQNQTYVLATASGGSSNAYTATMTPPLSALTAGQRISFTAAFTNTNNQVGDFSTLDVDGLGPIQLWSGTLLNQVPVFAGAIQMGSTYDVFYDGTRFIVQNPSSTVEGYQIAAQSWTYSADSGIADAYEITVPSFILDIFGNINPGAKFSFLAANTNTGASTIKVTDSSGATETANIFNNGGTPLTAGEIVAGRTYELIRNATEYVLLNPTTQSLTSPLTTKGDIWVWSTTNDRLAVGGTNGQVLQVNSADATGLSYSTATYPTVATSTGSFLYADGTNYVESTSLWPNTVGAAGKIIISDGTNNIYSTPTYPSTAGSSGNVLTSDGTNWISSPAAGGGVFTAGGTNSAQGPNSTAAGSNSISLGASAAAAGDDSTALGTSTVASGQSSVAMGNAASANATYAISIGDNSKAQGNSGSVSIGRNAKSGGGNAVSIGIAAFGNGLNAVAIGNSTFAANTAVGLGSGQANNTGSIAIGANSPSANGNFACAIGNSASANNAGSFVFWDSNGSGKSDTSSNQFVMTFAGGHYFYKDSSTLWVSIDTSGNLINSKGTSDQSYSLQVPTTGFSITIGAGVKTLILNPAGTLATGTIVMPASPIDGQEIRVTSSQTVTGLTVNANTGQTISNAPTTLVAGKGFSYIYNTSGTNWYCLNQ